jgi:hypothetical protein
LYLSKFFGITWYGKNVEPTGEYYQTGYFITSKMMCMKKLMLILSVTAGLTLASNSELRAQDKKKTVIENGDGTKTVIKTKTKKSRKGKYTAIGAGAGAATGVAVSKNNSKGAIIGGAAGAAGGYLLGRHKDKKKPKTKTVQKTKKVDDK